MTKAIAKKTPSTLDAIIMSDAFKNQLKLALPKHLTPDRFARIALTELRKNPDLMLCNQKSFLGAIIQCSQLGLEPGSSLGVAYLLPYNNKKANTKECQLIVGYRGLIELARRSGQIVSISAHCFYENDEFNWEYGINEKLYHKPAIDQDRGYMKGAYAIARFKDGGYQFEVMSKQQIDNIRTSSKAANSSYSPWNTHYDEMARKTVIRRLCKYLPLSPEMHQAIILDEKADVGKQDLAKEYEIFDNETEEIIEEKPQSQTDKMKEKLSSTEQDIKEVFGD